MPSDPTESPDYVTHESREFPDLECQDDEDAEEVDQIAYDQAAYPRTLSTQLRREW
jgi:hypothetical protein